MGYDRRKFLTSLGKVTAAGFILPSPFSQGRGTEPRTGSGRLKTAVLFDPSFPGDRVEIPLSREVLTEGLRDVDAVFLTVGEVARALTSGSFDLFVNPYGSAFPAEIYSALETYLVAGGNWLNLGGTPLASPVARSGNGWRREAGQAGYYQRFGITASFPVDVSDITTYVRNSEVEAEVPEHDEFRAVRIDELYCRFTSSKDFPAEDGSSGPRDARIRSLSCAIDHEGVRIAAPFVVIERLLGDYAGGTWTFATLTGTLNASAIRRLVRFSALHPVEFRIIPSFAAYHQGERPSFTAHILCHGGPGERIQPERFDAVLKDRSGRRISSVSVSVPRQPDPIVIGFDFPHPGEQLNTGLYRLEGVLACSSPSGGQCERRASNGFWVYDDRVLSGGDRISADENYLYRNGKLFPVTGTTYMASDVQRKFLFEPNPALWDRDFAEMKSAGINMIRTGIWTGWRNIMFDSGVVSEQVLRAIDAFILTALAHEIPVIFTLFAFLPEAWGGENPYLDPRSVAAQKQFVAAIVSRYRRVKPLIWDIINEPSFCNPAHLWETRPNYDRFERAAWSEYIAEISRGAAAENRPGPDEWFREHSGSAGDLPTPGDFEEVAIYTDRHPIKAMEYRRFAEVMFLNWVSVMRETIRNEGNPDQLVTIGQDEGGTGESPNNQKFGGSVDFTSVHNWWLNDDLAWDSIVTHKAGKANLVEETGVMYYETNTRAPWRSEEDASRLLERKLAVALAAGGAGFIEWLWNANPYMNSDNEAAIGIFRPDGTAKPELLPLRRSAGFFRKFADYFSEPAAPEVLLLIPEAGLYSQRSNTADATKRAVRTLTGRSHVVVASAMDSGEISIAPTVKAVFYPAARLISERAWSSLLTAVDNGATVFISGPVETDDHWMDVPRLGKFNLTARVAPVAQEEEIVFEGKRHILDFRGDKIQRVEKAVVSGTGTAAVHELRYGKGVMIWSPVPVELSDSSGVTETIYDGVLRAAHVTRFVSIEPDTPLVAAVPVTCGRAIFCALISETDAPVDLSVRHLATGTAAGVTVQGGRTLLLLIDRVTGALIAKLN